MGDTSALDELNRKYNEKVNEAVRLEQQLAAARETHSGELGKYGKILQLLMEYYKEIKRGTRRGLSLDEIENNPDRFVTEILLAALEKYPSKFMKFVRDQTSHRTGANASSSAGAGLMWDDNESKHSVGSPTDSAEEVKWWSTDNAAYLDTASRLDVKTVIASSSSSTAKRSSVVPQSSPVSRRRDIRSIAIQTDIDDILFLQEDKFDDSSVISSLAQNSSILSSLARIAVGVHSNNSLGGLDSVSSADSLFIENAMSVDRGMGRQKGIHKPLGGSASTGGLNRSYEAMNFRKKKVLKLPRISTASSLNLSDDLGAHFSVDGQHFLSSKK